MPVIAFEHSHVSEWVILKDIFFGHESFMLDNCDEKCRWPREERTPSYEGGSNWNAINIFNSFEIVSLNEIREISSFESFVAAPAPNVKCQLEW